MKTALIAITAATLALPALADTPRLDRIEDRVDAYRAQPLDDRVDARLLDRSVRVDTRLGRETPDPVTDRLVERADRLDARIANVPCSTEAGAAACDAAAARVDRRIGARRAFRDWRFD